MNTSSDPPSDGPLSVFPVPPQRPLDKGRSSDLAAWTRRWLESLPVANPETVVAQIGGLAGKLSRLRLLKEERIQVLELLAVPTGEAVKALCRRVCASPEPLRDRDRGLVDGIIGLHRALALAYRCALSDDTRAERRQGRRGGFDTLAAFRALSHLEAALQICYRLHLKPADSIWARVYGLYLHARAEGIAERPPPPNISPEGHDVATLFKRMVLLSVSGPEALRRDEVGQLIEALPLLAPHLESAGADAITGETPIFVAEPGADKPPRVNGHRGWHGRGASTRLYLDPAPLIQRLGRGASGGSGPEGGEPALRGALPPRLLEILLQSWAPEEKKRSTRKAQGLRLSLVAGFREVHAFLDPASAAAGRGEVAAPASLELLEPGVIQAPPLPPDSRQGRVARPVVCSALNQSAKGYRLAAPVEDAGRIAVGELVILREGEQAPWFPAVIKWVVSGRRYRHFGVELMAPGVQPGVLRSQSSGDAAGSQCLLLPAGPGTDGPLRLAIRPVSLDAGEHLRVLVPGQVLDLAAIMALHRSPAFDLYSVELLRRGNLAPRSGASATRSGAQLPLGFDLVRREGD